MVVGAGRGTYAIHRELWAPGVITATEAVDFVNGLLASEIARRVPDPRSILDLGCGVGGTMFRLAGTFPAATLTGVTVSPVQVRAGRGLAARRGLSDRCRFVEAAFGSTAIEKGFHAAVAIESFAHVSDAGTFFGCASGALAPEGVLLVVDDFLSGPEAGLSTAQRARVADVRSGWRVPGLGTVERARAAADAAGLELVEDRDLTALVRLGRPRDRVIAALTPTFRALRLGRFPFFGNMIGGDALQRCLRDGAIRYRMLVFEKR